MGRPWWRGLSDPLRSLVHESHALFSAPPNCESVRGAWQACLRGGTRTLLLYPAERLEKTKLPLGPLFYRWQEVCQAPGMLPR